MTRAKVDTQREEAAEIVREALVWDNHACMPLRPDDQSFLPRLLDRSMADLNVISLNVGFGTIPAETHLDMLASFRNWIDANQDRVQLVRGVADIASARVRDKLAVMFDVEGMAPLNGGRIDLVETFRKAGVGWMLVAYNRSNDAGGGVYDDDPGLTAYGRDVLAEMKRVGMIVCCSHTGHRTAMDAIEHAGNPVIFSHSNASALNPHTRNIPDVLIRACAQTGGVVGVNGLGHFLGDNDASPEKVATHIDHMVQLVGPAHVGIALDYVFDQVELMEYLTKMRETFPDDSSLREPPNMLASSGIVDVATRLLTRGYNRADLEAILGGNWLRVAQEVWRPESGVKGHVQ